MKKEMMVLIDTSEKFDEIIKSDRYTEQKEDSLNKYPDVDEYDLGYANGFTDALTNAAVGVANGNRDETSEFFNAMENESTPPIDIVTINSIGHVVEPDDEDDPEDDEYMDEINENIFSDVIEEEDD